MKPVKDMHLRGGEKAEEIIKAMAEGGGFSAKDLADGADILQKGLREEGTLRILSFPAAIVETGARGVIADSKRWSGLSKIEAELISKRRIFVN